jgi:kynurenine formamidase
MMMFSDISRLVTGAVADLHSDFGRDAWKQFAVETMEQYRAAIIGCGSRAGAHIDAYRHVPGARMRRFGRSTRLIRRRRNWRS